MLKGDKADIPTSQWRKCPSWSRPSNHIFFRHDIRYALATVELSLRRWLQPEEGSAFPLPGRILPLRKNSRSLAAPVMTRTIAVATTQLSSRRWLQPEEGSAFPLSGRILPLRTNCRSLAAPVMTKIGRAADVTAQAGQVSAIALQNLEHLHGRQRSSGRQRNFRFLRFNEAVHAVKRNSRQGRPQFEAREAFSGSGVL